MLYALVSDIHANLAALEAVLEDARRFGVDYDHIICLGDVVGYGPQPAECVDIAEKFRITICGNHDWAVIHEPLGFNRVARAAIMWTKSVMKPHFYDLVGAKRRRFRWLENLPKSYRDGDVLYVHGSPRSPIDEYVLRSDLDEILYEMTPKLRENFEKTPWVSFCGHSHIPVILTDQPRYLDPKEYVGTELKLKDNHKYIINIGSVGQPRDRDPRACYVLFNDGDFTVRYRRVEYDIEKTVSLIRGTEELDEVVGERLKIGH